MAHGAYACRACSAAGRKPLKVLKVPAAAVVFMTQYCQVWLLLLAWQAYPTYDFAE